MLFLTIAYDKINSCTLIYINREFYIFAKFICEYFQIYFSLRLFSYINHSMKRI